MLSASNNVIATESRAFLKYLTRVREEIFRHYGADFDLKDEGNVSKLAYKEWLCLSPNEKKFFYDPGDASRMRPSNNKHFIRYVTWNIEELKSKYPNMPASSLTKHLAPMYKSLSKEDKMQYGLLTMSDYYNYKADHILLRRQQLRKIYSDPKRLMLLEMILYSKPKKPLTSYQWFIRSLGACLSVSSLAKWKALPEQKRTTFIRRFQVDELRYTYENELWRSKMLFSDLSSYDFDPMTLFNCEIPLEEMKKLVSNYSNLTENIFYYYLSYIIKEYFLDNGEKSIIDILEEATDHWYNLDDVKKVKFNPRFVHHLESQRSRLRRLTSKKQYELIHKMFALDNLMTEARKLRVDKQKLRLVSKLVDRPADQARFKLIGQIN